MGPWAAAGGGPGGFQFALDAGGGWPQPRRMSVLKALRQRIAPELNFLFTDAPVDRAGAIDCGWHGHAHAYHAFFVARMFGAAADLRVGDFAVISSLMPPLTTLEREPKHAWCSVGGVLPVDLSATFAQFGQAPQLHAAVIGDGPNGEWQVRYAEDESILDGNLESGNELLYIERSVCAETEAALLENPQLFLPAAAAGEAWADRHGPEIQAQIALHCFRCASTGGRSIRNRPTRDEAVAWIAGNYPEARAEILKLTRL